MSSTNPTPAERLKRALEEYWPDGCKQFDQKHRWFYIGNYTIEIESHTGRRNQEVAVIAAVAAAWFRKIARQKQSEWDSVVRLEVKEEPFGPVWARTLGIVRKAKEAADTFDEIYEAATEVA